MKLGQTFRRTVLENPILRLKLAQSSAYTWMNLCLMTILSASIALAFFRFVVSLHSAGLIAALPPEFRDEERLRLAENTIFRSRFNDFQFEVFMAIWLFPLVYLLFEGVNFTLLRKSRLTDDIRSLPVTPLQALFALYDWPYVKCAAVLAFALPFQLLPGTREGFPLFKEVPGILLRIYILVTPVIVSFALHRTLVLGPYLNDFHYRVGFVLGWGIWAMMFLLAVSLDTALGWRAEVMRILLWVANFILFFGTLRIPPEFVTADPPVSIRKWVKFRRSTARS